MEDFDVMLAGSVAAHAPAGAIPYQQFLNRVEPGTRAGTFQRVILRRAGVVAMDAATIDRQFPAHIDSTFTPQAISAMSHALQGVCETLQIRTPEKKAQIIATSTRPSVKPRRSRQPSAGSAFQSEGPDRSSSKCGMKTENAF